MTNPKKEQPKTLQLFIQGQGRTVVLLHGFISTHRYWNSVIEQLPTDKVRTVRPDLLGFGASPKPRRSAHTLDEHIEWLIRSFDGAAIRPPYVLVGHSMGAAIALHWAVREPERFSRLIISGLPFIEDGRLIDQVLSMSPRYHKLQHSQFRKRAAFQLAKGISYLPRTVAPLVIREVPTHIAKDTTRHKAHTRKKIVAQNFLSDMALEDLATVTVPISLIMATEDSLVADADMLAATATANPYAKLITVSGDHQIPLNHPKLFADAIRGV